MKTKFLVGGRRSGITTALIREASENNYGMIVSTEVARDCIKHQCKKMKIKCPIIVTIGEVISKKRPCLPVGKIVVDRADYILSILLVSYGVNADIATIGASVE